MQILSHCVRTKIIGATAVRSQTGLVRGHSIVGKLLARVVLKRLQLLADRVYPESQCGFQANRSTTDKVFSLRHFQEKCREQQQPLFVAFIDLTKAFDLVSRDGLFKILPKIGCSPRRLNIIRSFHEKNEGHCGF